MAKGLGRGLDAFFGEDVQSVKDVTENKKEEYLEKVVELNIIDVEPTLNQPRKSFDEEKLQELADSIKEHGVLQPILVVKMGKTYTIIAGERRWRAAKIAGLKTIPAIVKDYSDTKIKQVALIENIQREDLNPIEIAKAIKDLMDIDGYTMQDVSKITGKNLSTISNHMRLLKLPDEIINMVIEGKLVEAQARALLAVPDLDKQIELAQKVVDEKLTCREIEKIVYKDKPVKKNKKVTKKTALIEKIENELNDYFSTKVKVDAGRNKGKIVIQYFSNDELSRILDKLNINL